MSAQILDGYEHPVDLLMPHEDVYSGCAPPQKNGYPAWIRTMTKGSKGPCATVTPPGSGLRNLRCGYSTTARAFSANGKSEYLHQMFY